ncbi:MaoC/PaaZ C-terminal domain-containing protein [Virgibacillus byunsanensis]|uniref:MaoC/PaaZ C-terminal domain-containing protein n=1 Tax=Virgibacillus byunsanensis TaxID=570945 RepID=A0ABW3LR31_9BACI
MIEKTLSKEPIKPIDLVKYAGASGDFNPVHTVPEEALKMGHPSVIAHGMYVMGLVSQAIDKWFSYGKMNSFQVRFMAPIYPGDLLTIKGYLNDESVNHNLMKGEVEVVDGNNKIKLKGSFELFDKRR